MSINHERPDQDDAVSPVIGVMLMLVVTIIIAAFVASFAGTFGETAQKTPSAALDVKIVSNGGVDKDQYVMLIEHLAGDPIRTKDMRILSYYSPPSSASSAQTRGDVTSLKSAAMVNGVTVKIPYLNDLSRGGPGDPKVDFGNFTLIAGGILTSGTTTGTGARSGTSMLGFDVTDPKYEFGKGSIVEVKIIHIPSQKVLYSSEVVVQ